MSEMRRAAVRKQYRLFRTHVEKTQRQVEIQARLDQGRYWKIENGFVLPTDDERKAIARVLRVTEAELPNEQPTVIDEAQAS